MAIVPTPTQRAISSVISLENATPNQVKFVLAILDIALIDFGTHTESDRHRDRLLDVREVLVAYVEAQEAL